MHLPPGGAVSADRRRRPAPRVDGPGPRTAAPPRRESRTPVDDITPSAEDFLKAVYEIGRTGNAVSTTDLAHLLGLAAASVSGMARRLADAGLVTHAPYRGVRLTAAGRRTALRTLRRHRVIEAYLVRALGYPWDEVHPEAERLEHTASDTLVDRMAAAIGEPTTDPHGAPIPTRDGVVDDAPGESLASVDVGTAVTVLRVSDEDPLLLRHLAAMGLVPGASITVRERAPFGGPLVIDCGRVREHIGLPLAERVVVAVPGVRRSRRARRPDG
jgi:DtxR family transcriptional regulator, Mn-dependent transcriptional regulator